MSKPRPKDWPEQMQFIWDFAMDPCDAPITVWIELFWPALRQFILNWFEISVFGVMVAFFRPRYPLKGGRAIGHYSRHKKRSRVPKKIQWQGILDFDPSEFIGHQLGGALGLPDRPVGLWQTRFWLIEGVIERVAFWYSVMELSTEFLYTWTSSMAETVYCRARDDAVYMGRQEAWPELPIMGWVAFPIDDIIKLRRMSFATGFGCVPAVGRGVATFDAGVRCVDPLASGFASLRITVHHLDGSETVENVTREVPKGETAYLAPFTDVAAGELVTWEARVEGAIMEWVGVTAYVQCSP